ncbi:MAG: polyprenyl synthetase family protein [Bacteroidales bacterium]|nr:polyprenyl synthetase family protein [Bacteroidales bacterium]
MILQQIEQLLTDSLALFREELKRQTSDSHPIIKQVGEYIYNNRGKQLRPLLLLLCAQATQCPLPNMEMPAVAIELLHTSTLFHDDVVDNASVRRGAPTINALWGNKTAVLCGDYFLAHVLMLLHQYDNREVSYIVNNVALTMSRGELWQQHNSMQLDTDMDRYRRVIEQKTAALMSACCEIGSLNTPYREHLKLFGYHFGMTFQMRDDLLDYYSEQVSGKPQGNDLREKKMTLPLIEYAKLLSTAEREQLLAQIDSGEMSEEVIQHTITRVRESQAWTRCSTIMQQEAKKALNELRVLPPSPYTDSLQALCNYLLEPIV